MARSLLLLLLLFATACKGEDPRRTKISTGQSFSSKNFADLVHQKGALSFSATITTTARLIPDATDGPKKGFTLPTKKIVIHEHVTLAMDTRGNIHGKRDLSTEDGVEFHVMKRELCVRLRYQKFLCSTYSPDEVARRVKDLWGTFWEITRPLKGQVTWRKEGSCDVVRGCVRRALVREPRKGKEAPLLKHSSITELSGRLVEDHLGVPISAQVTYTVRGQKETEREVAFTVTYTHKLHPLKGAVPLPDPKMVLRNWERTRHLMDRKALLGDPIPRSLRYLYRR